MMNKHFSVILATVTGGIAALFTFYTALAILTNDDLHLIDISISYDPACDEVYHWAISDYPVDEFSYSDSFWNSVIAYAENHFEDSDLVLFTTTIYDTSDSSVDASLSSESNLR